MVYLVYMKGKLMKDSGTECSEPPSEMAVSMVTTGGSSLKRPAEDMLDSQADSSPMKLLSTAFLDQNKKFKKSNDEDDTRYFNNNGLDSDGGSIKPVSDPESEPDHEMLDSNKGDIARSSELPTSHQSPYPCVWMNGNSPMRGEGRERESSPPRQTATPRDVAAPLSTSSPPPPRPFPCVWMNGNGEESEASPQPPELQPINIEPQPEPDRERDSESMPVSDSVPMPYFPPMKPLVQADMAPVEQALPDATDAPPHGSPLPAVAAPTSLGNAASPSSQLGNTTIIDADGQSVEVCPLCQKVFKRKVYLQRHMEREHWSTAKVFKCQDCNYETKHQSNLSVHRRTHTGERPYHCGCCGQRYTQGHLLKSHIRSRHGGNMELYNLDKKSDSTRGRKSLDIKRELLTSPAAFPGASHPTPAYLKQEKISSLLAAAAAAASTPTSSSASSSDTAATKSPYMASSSAASFPHTPPSSMSRYMSSLNGYFGSMPPSANAAAAAAMMNPMLGSGLLSAPRFFPGPLPTGPLPISSPALPATAPLMPGLPNMDSSSSNNSMLIDSALKLPVKMPSPSKLSPNKPQSASFNSVSPRSPAPAPTSRPAQEEESMPQDLSMKKPTPPPASHTEQLSSQEVQHHVSSYPQEPSYEQRRTPATPSTPVAPSTQSIFPSSEEEVQDENRAPVSLPPPAPLYTPDHPSMHCPLDKNCSHEEKLKKLRKNVLRMLSVLTPDIGIENDINFETDQVDQLLYEVIYSNLD